jgi:hypothetical protein
MLRTLILWIFSKFNGMETKPIYHLIFDIDELGLKVYWRQLPPYIKQTTDQKEIFWFDPTVPNGVGPFTCLYDAMRNYTEVLKKRREAYHAKAPLQIVPTNVVHVDFKGKKKL